MLNRKKNNGGMSLVEVLVSMLVLSIAAVTVISTFSMATKVNMKTKQQQSVESLMENFLEYTEGGGTNYQSWFDVDATNYQDLTPSVTPGVTPEVKIEQLDNVEEGFFRYTVKVTTDNAPDEYDAPGGRLNDHGVIQFGGAGNNTILIDASGDDDTTVFENYYNEHVAVVAEDIAAGGSMVERSRSEVYSLIDREIWLNVATTPSGKIQLTAYKAYIIESSLELRATTSKLVQIPLYVSEEYDGADNTDSAAKHLDQIYLLYPNATLETSGGTDVRFLDRSGKLDAKLFIVKQTDALYPVTSVVGMADPFSSLGSVTVSCKERDGIGTLRIPYGLEIYCSANINMEGGTVTNVTPNNKTLVAKNDEVRIVKVTIEIYNAAGTTLLAKKEVTRLQ